ncbi:DNA polymerase I [Arboricoccus pini]|uniref:DNA polymerase I n=1 Tax=Arboricoccus pini TaxID=1963835 RepID=A0A212Q309_9PROT|nr:DNA polymerase I [Arboricoccus pini]SNB53660.1 DNA polymerase I [Arboricoccus pini]
MSEPAAKPRLVLIDGSGYIFRAFFALPPMTRPDGTPVNAVFGFANMLFRFLLDRPDDDIIVVFDASRKSFRSDLYEAYKANRAEPPPELVPQFALVREAARAFDLPAVEVEGFEADDLIASYSKAGRAAGHDVLVVSSDKDLMQLVGDGIAMWDPMKSKEIGREEVIEKFGVGPELVRDVLALAGDTSDNVPGVPGIGVKTAAQLVLEYGSLEGLLANLDKIKQPKRRQTLQDNVEKARLSYELVGLAFEAPLPISFEETGRKELDGAKLRAFCEANGLRSLQARIEQVVAPVPANPGIETDPAALERPTFETVREMAVLEAIVAKAYEVGYLAIDTETNSLNVGRADLVGVCLAVEAGHGYYVPLAHVDDFGQPVQGQLPLEAVIAALKPVLEDASVQKIGHNVKYELGILSRYGIMMGPTDCTMLLSYVLDGASHGHGMDELAALHLGYQTIPFSAVCGKGVAQITFDRAPIEKASDYAAEDAEVTLRLWQALKPRLIEQRMTTVYETLERPLAALLARLEVTGIKVDKARLHALSSDFTARMAELEIKAHKLAGRVFSLGSPKQLGEVLFDEMGLQSAAGGANRKTKTGAYATGADILEELAASGHELPQVLLDWRQLQKLTRTYTDALIEEVGPKTGRVHTSFSMAATATGRLSSNDPNLQNIPVRTEEGRKIRGAFIAEAGFELLSADYSQIELRVLAHMADIQALKEAFSQDIDIHAVTAAQMFKREVQDVGADLRRSAKMINYGIIYGIGAFGLAQRLGIAQAEARAYIEAYFAQYPGIRDYMERAKAEAREQGYVATLYGRRCYTPDILSKLPARRSYAERAAINAPIQGTAADIMKRAMLKVARALETEGSKTRMLLQVHDELVFEVPTDELHAASALIRREMESAADLSVRLTVDIGHGLTWNDAH